MTQKKTNQMTYNPSFMEAQLFDLAKALSPVIYQHCIQKYPDLPEDKLPSLVAMKTYEQALAIFNKIDKELG